MTLWPGLTRKESWRRYCDKTPRVQPERLTLTELRALGEGARQEYDESRYDWHPNMPFIKTPQLIEVHRVLNLIADSNRQDSDRIRGVGAIDAFPGLGRTPSPTRSDDPSTAVRSAATARRPTPGILDCRCSE